MYGKQVEQFLSLILNIIDFPKIKVEQINTVNYIITLLEYYPKIDKFLRISKVIDTNSSLEDQDK